MYKIFSITQIGPQGQILNFLKTFSENLITENEKRKTAKLEFKLNANYPHYSRAFETIVNLTNQIQAHQENHPICECIKMTSLLISEKRLE